MRSGPRLALYGAGLVVAFVAAFGIASAVIPDSVVSSRQDMAGMDDHGSGHGATEHQSGGHMPKGLSLDTDGYALSPVVAPTTVGTEGELSFQIFDETGKPVTAFTKAHEKDLHLIVVRSDGSQFRHVHPALNVNTGTWSLPWTWNEAGTYRVYADFTPVGENSSVITLTRTVEVAGNFTPVDPAVKHTDEVDGYTVSLDGQLAAGSSNQITISFEHEGSPVTNLQPYLGAFGHLVALRQGDLAYLHVHAEGADPKPGQTSGPDIKFVAEAPTAGRYLLYLDFQVDRKVHTAEFVLDATQSRTE